jgi:hypothetical protein
LGNKTRILTTATITTFTLFTHNFPGIELESFSPFPFFISRSSLFIFVNRACQCRYVWRGEERERERERENPKEE